jgi:hypothetical protein
VKDGERIKDGWTRDMNNLFVIARRYDDEAIPDYAVQLYKAAL